MSTRATGCGFSPASAELQVSSVSVYCGSSGLGASSEYSILSTSPHKKRGSTAVREQQHNISKGHGACGLAAHMPLQTQPQPLVVPHNIRRGAKICNLCFSQQVRVDSSKDSLLALYLFQLFFSFHCCYSMKQGLICNVLPAGQNKQIASLFVLGVSNKKVQPTVLCP